MMLRCGFLDGHHICVLVPLYICVNQYTHKFHVWCDGAWVIGGMFRA